MVRSVAPAVTARTVRQVTLIHPSKSTLEVGFVSAMLQSEFKACRSVRMAHKAAPLYERFSSVFRAVGCLDKRPTQSAWHCS